MKTDRPLKRSRNHRELKERATNHLDNHFYIHHCTLSQHGMVFRR